ncbi:MAG: zinc-dependent alcohol dehydrogenase [Spirochaetia bacterium]
MIETLAIARHAVNRVPASLEDTAVVVGTGMVGLLVVQLLKAAGCRQVIAVDNNPDRIKTALEIGADIGINPLDRNPEEEIKKVTSGRGADAAYEVVGITPTVETAVKSVRKGGRIALVGNISAAVELPLQSAVTREITLHGSCASRGEYEGVIALLETGLLNLDAMISAAAPLSEGAEWFGRLYKKEETLKKVILKP